MTRGGRAITITRRSPGFSLIEVTAVTVIVAVIGVAVLPAFGLLRDARRAAALNAVESTLELARGRAMASGTPMGVEIDAPTSTLRPVQRDPATGTAEPALDPLGAPFPILDLDAAYVGVVIESLTLGDGSTGSGAIWFDHDGAPHGRTVGGAFNGNFAAPTTLTLSGGDQIIVTPHAGAVLRVQP